MSSLFIGILVVFVAQACDVVAQTPLHEAFESVISDYNEPIRPVVRRPIVSQTQYISPTAGDRRWQPQGVRSRGQLKWGVRLAQAQDTPSDVPQLEAELAEARPSPESLPPPRVEGTIPLAKSPPADAVQMSQDEDGLMNLIVRDASLSQVLALFAQQQGLNIVAANDIDALISITLYKVPPEEALTAILSVANYTWVQRNNIILVTSLSDPTLPADVQDRQIQIFELNFASATAVAEAVQSFVSPVGKVSISASDPADSRRARELVVVEDMPASLARIAAYIEQIDCPPRQVLIEAHVLRVTLTDETRFGVDLHGICRLAGAGVNIYSVPTLAGDFNAVEAPDAPALLATFNSHDLDAIIDALQSTTDLKSLGSPKLLVLNGQQARIQVGETLYYSQITTTQTSSQQGAASVETGVILELTPRITQDGRVLLRVEPELSSADPLATPDPGLPPNLRKIQLRSDVMLDDGQGMVIGGLIRETDDVTQSKLPFLGEVKGIGWLFRQTTRNKVREEIIFALVPRIQPYDPQYQAFEQGELVRAGVPLLHPQRGPLKRTYRPWDPVLPDGKRVYRRLLPQGRDIKRHWMHGDAPQYDPWTAEYVVPPHPLPEQQFYDPSDPHCETPIENKFQQPLLSDEALPMGAGTTRRMQP